MLNIISLYSLSVYACICVYICIRLCTLLLVSHIVIVIEKSEVVTRKARSASKMSF